MRRTNHELEEMRIAVKQLLSENQNDAHKAFESLVKKSLLSGSPIPTYIHGIKDFIKTSQESNGRENSQK